MRKLLGTRIRQQCQPSCYSSGLGRTTISGMTNSTEPSNAHTTRREKRTSLSSSDEQDDVGTEVSSKLVIELMKAMPAATVKPAIREVAMAPHSSAAHIVVFQGCQGTASIWWVDKAGGPQVRPPSILASAQIHPQTPQGPGTG